VQVLPTAVDRGSEAFEANRVAMLAKLADLDVEQSKARAGGGERYVERHRARGKLLSAGEVLVVLEAMKMEHAVAAPGDGRVAEVRVAVGQVVDTGAVLAVVEAAD
jgi:acetyl/propionyl-CoA carboxylase alpha subunit